MKVKLTWREKLRPGKAIDALPRKSNSKKSSRKFDLLFDALAKWTLFHLSIFVIALFIVMYVIYKIYFPDFGLDVRIEFYETIAQIMPAILIALFLTPKTPKRRKKDEKASSIAWNLISNGGFIGIAGLFFGEVASLWAIQRGYSGTGLFTAALFGLGLMSFLAVSRIARHGAGE